MSTSKAEIDRRNGKHQVTEQKQHILDAAERLFLQNGLENTTMVDIAARAGITKVTLYRYFPNIDAIALEIHVRMINKIIATLDSGNLEISLAFARKLSQSMIRNFDALRDAYLYMGIFDSMYLDQSFDTDLPQRTKHQLIPLLWNGADLLENARDDPEGNRFIMVLTTVIWTLEKLALRGEFTWSDQHTPLENQLLLFEEMILGYIDRRLETDEHGSD
jgi:AcrR family transcriptional regulator